MRFVLVREQDIQKFCYWEDGICQGMQHSNEFYQHVTSVLSDQRLAAYKLSDELLEAGSSVCLTVSAQGYSVWQRFQDCPPSA